MKGYENKPNEVEVLTDAVSLEKTRESEEDLSELSVDQDMVTAEALAPEASLEEGIIELPEDEYHDSDEQAVHRWHFSPPTRTQLWTGIAFGGIILLAAILRFWALGDRPLHHDESLHGYYSRLLLLDNIQNWASCFNAPSNICYRYDPLLHGPFQFHIIALVYQISSWLGVPDHGANPVTLRIAAATLGTVIVGLPYFLRHHLGKVGAWLACFLLAVSPGMVYFSRFAREDIYMACFTLLMVVSAAEYIRTRKVSWFILGVLGFVLAYATKEATFLTIAIFGSFFGALIVWELAANWHLPTVLSRYLDKILGRDVVPLPALRQNVLADKVQATDEVSLQELPEDGEAGIVEHPTQRRNLPAAPAVLLAYLAILAVLAKVFFDWLKYLGALITAYPSKADLYVADLKQKTVMIIPWFGIVLALVVIGLLLAEQFGYISTEGRNRLARKIDPRKQRLLDTVVTMPWTHWFFGFVLGWTVFLLLFTALFTYIPNGIGDGIWQGIYYWLQQQNVQRGGQPWYYYLMLIPLYEQVGVVFGLVGIVRSLLRPTRFRLFLIWWFVGSFFIYSWAGEKMPWLMIHITMPMLLLAAIGLEPAVQGVYRLAKDLYQRFMTRTASGGLSFASWQTVGARISSGKSVVACLLAVFLLVITLQNMVQVTYIHPAAAQYEMMIYVQTTPNVPLVMQKIEELDKKYYGGKREIPVGVMNDVNWPYFWYLRDYTNVCYSYQLGAKCPINGEVPPVIIADSLHMDQAQQLYAGTYLYHQYEMRAQWNQGYMPLPCIPAPSKACEGQQYSGVGPLSWLSYGNNPPSVGAYDLRLIMQNVWTWWWTRKPFGGIDTGYEMALLLRSNLGVQP